MFIYQKLPCSQTYVVCLSLMACIMLIGRTSPVSATDLETFGGNGGSAYRMVCPDGSFLGGFSGRAGDFIDKLSLICRRWESNQHTLGPDHVESAFSAGTSEGGTPLIVSCPAGHAVFGAQWAFLRSANKLLDNFSLRCMFVPRMEPSLSGPHTSTNESEGSDPCWLEITFCDFDDYRPELPLMQCPEGELAIGIHGRSGEYIDSIGLICDLSPQASRQQQIHERIVSPPGRPIESKRHSLN